MLIYLEISFALKMYFVFLAHLSIAKGELLGSLEDCHQYFALDIDNTTKPISTNLTSILHGIFLKDSMQNLERKTF